MWRFLTEGDFGSLQYISRCPFSLTRMIALTPEGKVLHRASKPKCIRFPVTGDPELVDPRINARWK
jgi:hypothetical protein